MCGDGKKQGSCVSQLELRGMESWALDSVGDEPEIQGLGVVGVPQELNRLMCMLGAQLVPSLPYANTRHPGSPLPAHLAKPVLDPRLNPTAPASSALLPSQACGDSYSSG